MTATYPKQAATRTVEPSTAAFKWAANIAAQWGVSDEQLSVLLGGIGRSTVQRWKQQLAADGAIRADFGPDTMDRVSYMLGIYKALHILFPDSGRADAWIKKPNDGPGFDGKSALDRMLGGRMDDLRYVRVYLDGWRG